MRLDDARQTLRSFDYLLFGAVALLVALGIIFIDSASVRSEEWGRVTQLPYANTQFRWALIAVGAFFAILVPRYTRVRGFVPVLYVLVIALLLYTLEYGIGTARSDVRRWLRIGYGGYTFSRFQPSQIAQVVMVLVLARYLMFRPKPGLKQIAAVFILTGIPMFLVLKQPDLGTALLFVPLPFVMLFVAGAPVRHLLTLAAMGLASVPVFWEFGMAGYQKMRFFAWIDPWRYELNEGWHYIQSRIAVGSGGLFGRGLGRGTQNSLNYLSERHTDFIFSVILEEWGFAGGVFIMFLYLVIIVSGLGIASRTREPFGRLVVVGVVSMLATQVFINMGMNIGLMPITGLTLPFISYGGSSLLASFAAVGIMMNVAVHPVPTLAREY